MIDNFLAGLQQGFPLVPVVLLLFCSAGMGRLMTMDHERNVDGGLFWAKLVLGLNGLYFLAAVAGSLGRIGGMVMPILSGGAFLAVIYLYGKTWIFELICFIRENRFFALICAIIMLFFAAPVFCFPLGWDSHTYHLALPLRWLADNRALIYSDLPYSGFPSGAEFIYWCLLRGGDIRAPGLLVWLATMLAGVWIYLRLKSVAALPVSLAAALAFIGSPVTLMLMKESYVEPLLLLNLLAALDLADDDLLRDNFYRRSLFLGVLAGGACALKLNGVLVAAAIVLWGLPWPWRGKKNYVYLAVTGGTALAFMLPFYLRPWLLTGNPFFPFFSRWFSDNMAYLLSGEYHHAVASMKYGVCGLAGFVTAPLLLCWESRWFDGSFGLPALIFLIAALIFLWTGVRRRGRDWEIWRPFAIMLLLYVGWFFTAQQARFLLPGLVIVILIGGRWLSLLRRRWQWCMLVLIVGLILPGIFIPARHAWNCWFFIGGGVGLKDYIYTGTGPGYLSAAEMVATKTPPEAKILLLFDHRSLLIPRYTELGTPYFQSKYFTPPPLEGDALMRQLTDNRISYLLVGESPNNPDNLDAYRGRMDVLRGGIAELVKNGRLQLEWSGEGFSLYRVNR